MSSSTTDRSTVDVTMPQMGVSAAEGTVVAWAKEAGDWVEADETICQISTDKIDADVPAPASGRVSEVLVAVEQTVPLGAVLARIATDASPGEGHAGEVHRHRRASATLRAGRPADRGRARHRPRSRRGHRARRPRAQAGRARAIEARERPPQPPLHIESPYRPQPSPVERAGDRGERLSRMRRSIAEHMLHSLRTAAHCTTIVEVDMSRVEAKRAATGTTYLPWVARATVEALREFPMLNATLEGDVLTRRRDVNLGVAVSLGEDGLIVPVLHRAQDLSVRGLAARIAELARRARARELGSDDVAQGTFTITSPGAFGAIAATPIINQPQVAILDLEAVMKRPVVVPDGAGGDALAIRPIANLCLSWDHRALDGAVAARFLSALRRNLEAAGSV